MVLRDCENLPSPAGLGVRNRAWTDGPWHAHALLAGTPPRIPTACDMWKARNGHIDVQAVREIRGVTLYASKSAGAAGEIVWSDTCRRYRSVAKATDVTLHPMNESSTSVDFGTPNGASGAWDRA